jgi:hypothetical protein
MPAKKSPTGNGSRRDAFHASASQQKKQMAKLAEQDSAAGKLSGPRAGNQQIKESLKNATESGSDRVTLSMKEDISGTLRLIDTMSKKEQMKLKALRKKLVALNN